MKRFVFGSLVALAVTFPVEAEESKWYIGINTGLSYTPDTHLSDGSDTGVFETSKSLLSNIYGNINVGVYDFPYRGFVSEAGVSFLNMHGKNGGSGLVTTDGENGRLNFYLTEILVGGYKKFSENTTVFGMVGPVFGYVENHDLMNSPSNSKSLGGSYEYGFAGKLGMDYKITESVSFVTEGKAYYFPDVDFDYGSRSNDLVSYTVSVGVRYNF